VTADHVPAVAIVVATFNRPAALRCALLSAVGQSFQDWELIVVGDACTGTTASVVEDVADSRIRYVNLPTNVGEQSGPNNVGVARTTAPLLAFLNHDDLWFPDHLEHALVALEARAADLAFSPTFTVAAGGQVIVDALPRNGRYDPHQIDRATPASGWLVRRDALHRLRGWRSARECRVEPSQDLLFRAHRAGMRLWGTGMPTVISVPSGDRARSYLGDHAAEQVALLERLGDPALRSELFAAAGAPMERRPRHLEVWFSVIRTAERFGVSPRTIDYAVRRRLAKGDLVNSFRRTRGLDSPTVDVDGVRDMRRSQTRNVCLIPRDGEIDFAAGRGGERFCAAGWSTPESWGTWSDGTRAELMFRWTEPFGHAIDLTIDVIAHVDQRHRAQLVGIDVARGRIDYELEGGGPHQLHLRLERRGDQPVTVRFELPNAWTPPGRDNRRLAIGVLSASARSADDDDQAEPRAGCNASAP
jgi:glycosyltransferase involved in cell wall biosynthesis